MTTDTGEATDALPVRVVSDHLPLGQQHGGRVWPPECRACGLSWPCHTFQRNLQGQSDNQADRMRAHMTIWTLRMLSRPELSFVGREVSAQLLGWIDGAVVAQQRLERARLAVQRITTYARNLRDSLFTDGRGRRPVMGQPPRGVVQYGDVLDGDEVVSRRG